MSMQLDRKNTLCIEESGDMRIAFGELRFENRGRTFCHKFLLLLITV